jgi:hypothetical protein
MITTDVTPVTDGTTDNNGLPKDATAGQIYATNGKLYQVGTAADGTTLQGTEINLPTDPWNDSANKIMALDSKNAADQQSAITKAKVSTLVADDGTIKQGANWANVTSTSDPVYKQALADTTDVINSNTTANQGRWSVTPTVGKMYKIPVGDGTYVLGTATSGDPNSYMMTFKTVDGKTGTFYAPNKTIEFDK